MITERPARVRVLGRSQMVPLNASALVVMTGNGLTVSEDLARRFIMVELDPRTEEPEARRFEVDIRAEVGKRRQELLAALLTIWRWGRQSNALSECRPLGSFEQWCRWVRDPLVALGCADPVDRVSEAKERDGRRQTIHSTFELWWDRHGDPPLAVRDIHPDVQGMLDPQGRGRQFIASQLGKLTGTRLGGFVLTRQAPSGKWGTATYALQPTDDRQRHREHRGHRGTEADTDGQISPMTPMTPMPSETNDDLNELYEERAAFLEYEGGLTRDDAEACAEREIAALRAAHG